ncbi:3-isopropylmalate/(R)-2-methylmalate dehydratase large subunit [Enhydrobacter aerosaccus]|uniref:3-isopropylmalate dehydratase n=1 Tax=Enhydrobacter aerosaccus TaxID=225324 RepID=A0A1T4K788_9HYPH|nr:3-isopropylmalate dehydratase large subunit [Enhydrobacter aerosaccus]SJZ38282.1 3-isopropylmalate/(R)-2-methylmalate dehydratase large subunit [Enhydrobacter aerosaccus]
MPSTLFDRLWEAHVVAELGGGWALLHIDRHLLHDLSGSGGLATLAERGLPLNRPDLTFATADHAVSSAPGRTGETYDQGAPLYRVLREQSQKVGIPFFDIGQRGQGIVHVMAPELGITLPGTTLVCGDSHTCTHGGLGALAFGIGSSELVHVLATQTLRQKKPRQMRIVYEGALKPGVTAKDLALHVIGTLGAAAGTGHAIEHAGPGIAALPIEARLTLCNMSVELGSKIALCAPDQATVDYLRGKPFAPAGADFDAAIADWSELRTDDGARFDREALFNLGCVPPTITWGTSPEHAIAIDGTAPDPCAAPDAARREAWQAALDYMGLTPGQKLCGTPVDWVFIGSCANARLTDLRDAARVVRGRRVAAAVKAWVVPGSVEVKDAAEAEGLDEIFRAAGFEWREPGCSMCVAANGEVVPPGRRAVSTSNRNFVGRQGPGARTHLASPASAAAAAIAGAIADIREI